MSPESGWYRGDVASQEYKEYRKTKKIDILGQFASFGSESLDYVDEIRGSKSLNQDARIGALFEKSKKQLKRYNRGFLTELFGSPIFFEAVNDPLFVAEMRQNTVLLEWINQSPDGLSAESLKDAFDEGLMPDALYEKMLRIHRNKFKSDSERFREQLPEYLDRIRKKFFAAIDQGMLPISKERFEETLSDYSFGLQDAVEANFELTGGLHYIAERRILIAQSVSDQAEVERALAHEIFHALAGQTVLAKDTYYDVPGFKATVTDFGFRKGGLRFGKIKTGATRLSWLNEAVTQQLTFNLGYDAKGIYKQEMTLLSLLQEKGARAINLESFTQAYFENYSQKKGQAPVAAWSSLVRQINEAYCPNFLIYLEDYIRSHSLNKAISAMKQSWKRIVPKNKRPPTRGKKVK